MNFYNQKALGVSSVVITNEANHFYFRYICDETTILLRLTTNHTKKCIKRKQLIAIFVKRAKLKSVIILLWLVKKYRHRLNQITNNKMRKKRKKSFKRQQMNKAFSVFFVESYEFCTIWCISHCFFNTKDYKWSGLIITELLL